MERALRDVGYSEKDIQRMMRELMARLIGARRRVRHLEEDAGDKELHATAKAFFTDCCRMGDASPAQCQAQRLKCSSRLRHLSISFVTAAIWED